MLNYCVENFDNLTIFGSGFDCGKLMHFLSTNFILWKNVENSQKYSIYRAILMFIMWIVENFQNFHKKLWKNGVMITLPLLVICYDDFRFLLK